MNPVDAALVAKLALFVKYFAIDIHAAAFQRRFLDRHQQGLVFLGAFTLRVQTQGIKADAMRLDHFAKTADRELVL